MTPCFIFFFWLKMDKYVSIGSILIETTLLVTIIVIVALIILIAFGFLFRKRVLKSDGSQLNVSNQDLKLKRFILTI